MEDTADIIRAIASLLWPGLAIFAVWRLLPTLRKRLLSGDINVKVGQFELSVQQASDSLRKQVKDIQEAMEQLQERPVPAAGVGRTRGVAPRRGLDGTPRGGGRAVLWVDPEPERDAFEVSRLEDEGARVQVARTLDEAVTALSRQPYDVVVTAADRLLVDGIRQRSELPMVVYGPAGTSVPSDETVATSSLELFAELRALGVAG